MLTKNFYSYIKAALQRASADFTLTDGSTTQSDSISNSGKIPLKTMNAWARGNSSNGVGFGTGTTPASASDYKLESFLTHQKISVANPSQVSFNKFDTYEEYTVTFGVTNITAEAITISEVGLMATLDSSAGCNLVDRTVLDVPVTIPAGQSKQITYTIRFNY